MNWNPVVDALVEEYLGALEQREENMNPYCERYVNISQGRRRATLRVANRLGLSEHLKRELDYLLDEPEKELSGL